MKRKNTTIPMTALFVFTGCYSCDKDCRGWIMDHPTGYIFSKIFRHAIKASYFFLRHSFAATLPGGATVMMKSIAQGDAETRAELSPYLLQFVCLEEWVKILEKQ